MSECRCGRPTRDQAYTCDNCGDDLGRALGDVPWLEEELDVTISGQKAAGTSGHTSASAEKPLPVNWGASEARTHLRNILVLWVRFCEEENVRSSDTRRGLPDDNLTSMSRWLLWRVDGLLLLDIGIEAVEEITSAVAHCHRLVDRPADKVYLGPCEGCEAPMFAKVGRDTAKCRRCEREHHVSSKREALETEAMDNLMDRLFTASEAAMVLCAFGLAPKTDEVRLADRIRKWAKPVKLGRTTERPARLMTRGHVRRADQRTRPAYRLGDIRDLLLDTQSVA